MGQALNLFFFLGVIINVNLQVRKLKHKEVLSYSWEMAELGFQSKVITKALLNITTCGLPFIQFIECLLCA